MAIDKSPLYVQVMNYLLEKIEKEYKPGDLIPTQAELAEETGMSLITVKRAITELAGEGYLKPIAGKGTFVQKPPLKDEHTGISSWTDTVLELGDVPGTVWMDTRKRRPPAYIAANLRITPRDDTVLIDRLRSISGKRACLMANEFPLRLVPDMHKKSIDQESLYAWVKDIYGLFPVRAEEEVYARYASDEEKRELQMDDHIALVMKRISYLEDDTPFEVSQIIAPAESYRYRSKLTSNAVGNVEMRKLSKCPSL
jgi:DNA-binding GntR family transcriptional regulator